MIEVLLKWQAELPLNRSFRVFTTDLNLHIWLGEVQNIASTRAYNRVINLNEAKQCKFKMLEVAAEEMITEMRNAGG